MREIGTCSTSGQLCVSCMNYGSVGHPVLLAAISGQNNNLNTLINCQVRQLKVINHCIFRNLKAFLYGEEHRMYFCNIPVFMSREKRDSLVKIWLRRFKKKSLNDQKRRFSEDSVVNHIKLLWWATDGLAKDTVRKNLRTLPKWVRQM